MLVVAPGLMDVHGGSVDNSHDHENATAGAAAPNRRTAMLFADLDPALCQGLGGAPNDSPRTVVNTTIDSVG